MIDKSLLFKKNAEAGKKAMRAFRKYALQNEEATIKECWNHAEYTFRSVVSDYLEEFCDESFRYMYLQNIMEDCRDGMICQCKKEFLKIEKRRVWINIQKVYVEQTIRDFPHHLLSSILCIASVVVMSVCIQKDRKNRAIAIVLPIVLTIAILVLLKLTGRVLIS